jgi:hypothetical protein
MLVAKTKRWVVGWFMSNKLEGLWKEAVILFLNLLSQDSPTAVVPNHF